MTARRQAVGAVWEAIPGPPVGLTPETADCQACEPGVERALEARREPDGRPLLEAVAGDDFFGVQACTRVRVEPSGPLGPSGPLEPPPEARQTLMGPKFWPEALEGAIRRAHAETGLPMPGTESGVATDDDARRLECVRRALEGAQSCLGDGVPVLRCCYWGALDSFERVPGCEPTFGLIEVDRATQRRIRRPSARWLGAVAWASALP